MELIYKLMGITMAFAEDTGVTDTLETVGEQAVPGTGDIIISTLFSLAPMIALFAIMYFMMIRPEKKRKKKEQEMLAALKHGDRVCTIGGIYGTITNIKDDTLTLVVGRENMTMVVARWAIRSVEDVSIENDSEALN